MSMMIRYVTVAVVLSLLSYCSFSMYKSNAASNEAKAARERLAKKADKAIWQMAEKDRADSSWLKKLDENYADPMVQILTADLQRLWIIETPILFEGKIKDISRNTNNTYEIHAEYTSDNGRPHFYKDTLQLRLQCEETKTEELLKWLKKNPPMLYSKIALTATITSVDSAEVAHNGEEPELLKVGRGNCLTLMPIAEEVRD